MIFLIHVLLLLSWCTTYITPSVASSRKMRRDTHVTRFWNYMIYHLLLLCWHVWMNKKGEGTQTGYSITKYGSCISFVSMTGANQQGSNGEQGWRRTRHTLLNLYDVPFIAHVGTGLSQQQDEMNQTKYNITWYWNCHNFVITTGVSQ